MANEDILQLVSVCNIQAWVPWEVAVDLNAHCAEVTSMVQKACAFQAEEATPPGLTWQKFRFGKPLACTHAAGSQGATPEVVMTKLQRNEVVHDVEGQRHVYPVNERASVPLAGFLLLRGYTLR